MAKPTVSRDQTIIEAREFTPIPEKPSDRALATIDFLSRLRIPGGARSGSEWIVHPFQRDFLTMALEPGIRTAILSVPRKNGKTALCSGIILAALLGPLAIPDGEIVSAARSRDQAAIVFRFLVKLIQLCGWDDLFRIRETEKRITCKTTRAEYRALSADASNQHGGSPFLYVMDELGQVKRENDELFEAVSTSTGAHESPLGIIISTQSADDRALFSRLIDAALTGDDPSTACLLYRAPEDADPFDPTTWSACNPAVGAFRGDGDIESVANRARLIPATLASLRNLHLNQRVSTREQWLTAEAWEQCAEPVDLEAFERGRVYAGLDLSSTRDLTSLVLVVRDENDVIQVRPYFWLPDDEILERERRDAAQWRLWADEGFIELCPGKVVDYDFVAERLVEISAKYNVEAVAYDRWHIEHLRQRLEAIGGDNRVFCFVHRGRHISEPLAVRYQGDQVLAAELRHGSHPVLRYCARNCVAKSDPAGNRKIDKNLSTGHIDGAVAMAMAIHALTGKAEPKGLVDEVGLVIL